MTKFIRIDVNDHALLGTAEVAALAGVEMNTVRVWKRRGLLPAPIAELSCGDVWRKDHIVAWLKTRKDRA